jgi:hypothetical protein
MLNSVIMAVVNTYLFLYSNIAEMHSVYPVTLLLYQVQSYISLHVHSVFRLFNAD